MTSRSSQLSEDLLCRRLALALWDVSYKLAVKRVGEDHAEEVMRRTYGGNVPVHLTAMGIRENYEQFFELACQAVEEKLAQMEPGELA